MTPKEFFNRYYPDAKKAEAETHIPALAALSQCALETGWGGTIAGNMMFGIKQGQGWTGETQLLITHEVHSTDSVKYPVIISIVKRSDNKYLYKVKDFFRKYASPYDSLKDYSAFIHKNPRYAKALKQKDPILYLKEIAAAGYATDPEYFHKTSAICKILQALEKIPG